MSFYKSIPSKLQSALGSRWFFICTVLVFIGSALWLALTSRYPMAFDEDYHYKIIQYYSHQLSPWFSSPPAGSESLGDITRYPSYLYHYLLSFPYRLITLFTESDAIKILILRFINIALFASSFWIFKNLFEKINFSRALANVALFVFALIPVVPFLAAQISYDNATIPLTALTVWLALDIIVNLRAGKFILTRLLIFICVGLFTSLIKYPYVPIFVFTGLYILASLVFYGKKYRLCYWQIGLKQFIKLNKFKQFLLLGSLLLGLVLCLERYGVNMVKYRTPAPNCAQVVSEASCMQYGPWRRDQALKQVRETANPTWEVKDYSKVWLQIMRREFFFAINDRYEERPPLKILYTFSLIMFCLGLIGAILSSRKLLKNPNIRFLVGLVLLYALVLWLDNYAAFLTTHWPVAIHGRYLLPVLPLALIVLGYGVSLALDRVPKLQQQLKLVVAAICIAGMLYGGGALTYIVRSDSSWYWQNRAVITTNQNVQTLLKPWLK